VKRLLAILLLTVALLGAACSSDDDSSGEASGQAEDPAAWDLPDTYTAVLGRFIGAETAPVLGTDSRYHVVYELWLTNGRQVDASIDTIEVIDRDSEEVLAVLADDELLAASHELSTRPAADTELDPNESLLIFVSLSFDSVDDVPARLVHRLIGTGADNPGSREPQPIDYQFAPWDISRRTTPVIGPPLAGEGWVVVNGCCEGRGAHRGAVQTVNGTLLDSQRFAIDWMRIGDDGRFVGEGDPSDPAIWNAYGEDVLAIADGTVVQVMDGLEDQAPGSLPDPGSITLETVDGNHVILDLGGGLFVFYAHLSPGSVAVEVGDEVKAGDVVGELGNTGNTSAPHLHIHLMNRASAIASDSIPYQFDEFEITGSIDEDEWFGSADQEGLPLTDPFTVVEDDPPGVYTDALPLDLRIVTFAANAAN